MGCRIPRARVGSLVLWGLALALAGLSAQEMTLEEALDLAPNLSGMTTTGTLPLAQQLVTHDGEDAAQLFEGTSLELRLEHETGLGGPGVLDFWYRDGGARLLSGVEPGGPRYDTGSEEDGPLAWRRSEMIILDSGQTARWRADEDYIFLDQVQFRAAISVEEALGPDLTFTTGGSSWWVGYPLEAAPGGDAVNLRYTGNVPSNEVIETGWIETQIEGPGTLRYWASSSGGRYERFDHETGTQEVVESGFRLLIDGVQVAIHKNGLRQAFTHNLYSGTHSVRWAASKHWRDGAWGSWLAGVEFSTSGDTILGALDFKADAPNPVVQTRGPDHWSVVPDANAEGGSTLQLSLQRQFDSGELRVPVTGPQLIEFDWKADPFGTLEVHENGLSWPDHLYRVQASAQEDRWELASVFLPHGKSGVEIVCGGTSAHVTWTIDRLAVRDLVTLGEATDSEYVFTSGGTSPPVGLPSRAASDGTDHIGFVGSEASWVETTVTGPGTLHYHLRDSWRVVRLLVDGELFDDPGETSRDSMAGAVILDKGAHRVLWESAGGQNSQPYAFLDQLWFEALLPTDVLDWNGANPSRLRGDWQVSADAQQGASALTFEIPADAERLWRTYEIDVPVEGAGTLAFWAKTLTEPPQDRNFVVSFTDPAESQQVFEPTQGKWRFHEVPVPSDAVRATVRFANDYGGYQVWVDHLTLKPVVSLAEALDGSLSWHNAGSHPWATVTSDDSREGNSMVQTLFGAGTADALLETTVTGPGVLVFSWRAEPGVTVNWLLDGVEMGRPPGFTSPWERVEYAVGPGAHRVQWAASSYGRAWLDAISFSPDYLNEALDTTSRKTWGKSSEGWTTVDGEQAYDDDDALRLALTPGSEGYLAIPIDSPDVVSLVSIWTRATASGVKVHFWDSSYNRSSRIVFDDWQEHRFLAAPGQEAHLSIESFDHQGTVGDLLIVDRMTVTPVRDDLPLADAVDAPTHVFRTAGDHPWRGLAFAPESGPVDFAQAAEIGTEEAPSWIETAVTGPGTASFRWKGHGKGTFVLSEGALFPLPKTHVWENIQVTIPEGEQTLRWNFHSATGPLLDGLGALDAFRFEPETFPLNEALDLPSEALLSSQGFSLTVHWTPEGLDSLQVDEGRVHWLVDGPGSVWFRYRLNAGAVFNVLLDGAYVQTHDGPVAWTTGDLTFPEGPHTITLSIDPDRTEAVPEAHFDAFSFHPAAEVNALEQVTELPLTTGGAAPWHGEKTQQAPAGSNRLVSGSIEAGEVSWIETTVTGPGQLEFWWRVSERSDHAITLAVNGETVLTEYRGEGWQCVQTPIPPGAHTLRWTYKKHRSTRFASAAWLDGIVLHQGAIPLVEGSDFADIAMARSSSCWRLDKVHTYDGEDALVTGPHERDRTASLRSAALDLPNRTLLTYWWKRENENSGTLVFVTPKTEGLTPIEGSDGWRQERRVIPPGPQVLEWGHLTYTSPPGPAGKIWLDAIELAPLPQVPIAEALDAESLALTWRTSPEAPWAGEALESAFDGHDHAVSDRVSAQGESWLETSVMGPGELRFLWRRGAGAGARLVLDGEIADARHSPDSDGWREVHLLLSPGRHTIRWVSRSETIYLDGIGFSSIYEGLGQALDFVPHEGVVVLSGEPGMLIKQKAVTTDGEDSLAIQHDAVLTLPPLGMERLSVQARYTGRHGFGSSRVVLYAPGDEAEQRQQDVWQSLSVKVDGGGKGLILIRNPVSPEAFVWLDQLRGTGSGPTIAEALDTALEVVPSEPASWEPLHDYGAFDRIDFLQASKDFQNSSWIETTVEGPGRLRFMHMGRVYWTVNGIPFVHFSQSELYEDSPPEWRQAELLLPAGSYSIRWIPYEAKSKLDRLTYVPDGSVMAFSDWLLAHDLDGADALPAADPNRDGISNRVAWAFGLSPVVSLQEDKLPEGEILSTSLGDFLMMQFYRRSTEANVYRPQFSGDLKSWSNLFAEESVHDYGNGWQQVRVRDRVPVSGEGHRFGQVEIQESE